MSNLGAGHQYLRKVHLINGINQRKLTHNDRLTKAALVLSRYVRIPAIGAEYFLTMKVIQRSTLFLEQCSYKLLSGWFAQTNIIYDELQLYRDESSSTIKNNYL